MRGRDAGRRAAARGNNIYIFDRLCAHRASFERPLASCHAWTPATLPPQEPNILGSSLLPAPPYPPLSGPAIDQVFPFPRHLSFLFVSHPIPSIRPHFFTTAPFCSHTRRRVVVVATSKHGSLFDCYNRHCTQKVAIVTLTPSRLSHLSPYTFRQQSASMRVDTHCPFMHRYGAESVHSST